MSLEFMIRTKTKESDMPFILDTWSKHTLQENDWVDKNDVHLFLEMFKRYIRKCCKAYRIRIAYKTLTDVKDRIYGYTIHDKDKIIYTHIKWQYRPVKAIKQTLEEGLTNENR